MSLIVVEVGISGLRVQKTLEPAVTRPNMIVPVFSHFGIEIVLLLDISVHCVAATQFRSMAYSSTVAKGFT